jgi:hypothetical protein
MLCLRRRARQGQTALARRRSLADNDAVDAIRGASVALLLLVTTTACSGGERGTGDAGGAGDSTRPFTVTTSTTLPGSSTTAAVEDPAVGIRVAFETFYDGAGSTVDAKIAMLQDGERYRSMLEDASANPQFQSLAIDIREIRLADDGECAGLGASAPCAVVTHDLLVAGAPMLVAQDGIAVQVDGTWLVAASSWCAVVAIGGETCP